MSHVSLSTRIYICKLCPLPLDAVAGGVFGLQLADLDDVDAAVLQTHHAVRLAELDGVDGGADGAAGALDLVVGLVLVDDDGDAVVEEGATTEVGAVHLQQ